MTFKELISNEVICNALIKTGYTTPTPIQQQAIPPILEGKDVFGCAQTGTGKTAAFALPILQLLHEQRLSRHDIKIKALVLAPTRELAIQISESFREYGTGLNLRHTVVYGGVGQNPQTRALQNGVDILIATPGRLLDLMQQGFIHLKHIEFLVLDEADRMLDMGFVNDIKKILKVVPVKRQTVFFSATVPLEIASLASQILKNPVSVNVAVVSSPAEKVQQSVYYVDKTNKRDLLTYILKQEEIDHALIFTRTKRGADRVAKDLAKKGIKAEAIHGDKSQNSRQKALEGFKNRTVKILVATDIASRGIDVDKLTHVINFEIPEVPETYIHRIGRTGRAGEGGHAITLCSLDELSYLKDIKKLLPKELEVKTHPFTEVKNVEPFERPAPSNRSRNHGIAKQQAQSNFRRSRVRVA
ncbi:MAG TPA: DEAD/DEAH box helicase [Bacteroidia bacterium]|nr:DEAD/DEAH box helicase [Bacteroidia bacterium]